VGLDWEPSSPAALVDFRESFVIGLDESEKSDARFQVSPSMSDADRQLYFADFVIELQAAEDDKRRRIRDARRRAEKAQREGYRDTLRKLASEGKILPGTRWRSVEEIMSGEESYGLVHTQDRDTPRELFEEFLDEWGENYRRDRSFLGQLLQPSSKKEIVVNGNTTYEEFTKMLLNEAAYSPGVYGDTRRIINRDDPISSARLYYDDLVLRAKELDSAAASRQGNPLRMGSLVDSSEDEGEIIEEGEVTDDADGRTWAETRAMGDTTPQQEAAFVGNSAALSVSESSELETQNAAALLGEEGGEVDVGDLATPPTSATNGQILQDVCEEGSKSLPVNE
jgi:hypothetical protein